MHDVLFGSALVVSFLGGLVALLAPCCVTVMLPAFLASSFRRRVGLLAMTGVFAAGVATIILPIGLGARALSAAIAGHHLVVFAAGGSAMVALGLAVLSGWKPSLPTVGMRPNAGHGATSVYLLGPFSGAASACCAPVLAGVVVLAGASGSFVAPWPSVWPTWPAWSPPLAPWRWCGTSEAGARVGSWPSARSPYPSAAARDACLWARC